MRLRTRVKRGRLTLDETTPLPEGTTLDLVIADDRDELDDDERAALHKHLAEAWASIRQGKTRPVAAVLAELRRP